ncbi:MAG: hypothetical protein D3915_05865 [Candidatus Electrothrix sp. AU1_5]|nr:hypothetical protein [Candidatus Electrothrix gigas]
MFFPDSFRPSSNDHSNFSSSEDELKTCAEKKKTVSVFPDAGVASAKIEIFSVELPSVELPSVELPSVELPSVELPSVELPSVTSFLKLLSSPLSEEHDMKNNANKIANTICIVFFFI